MKIQITVIFLFICILSHGQKFHSKTESNNASISEWYSLQYDLEKLYKFPGYRIYKKEGYDVNQNNDSILSSRITYKCNNQANYIQIIKDFNFNQPIQEHHQTDLYYDVSNRLVSEKFSLKSDGSGNIHGKINYNYNSGGQDTGNNSWYFKDGQWVGNRKHEVEYTSTGKTRSYKHFEWSESKMKFEIVSEESYSYDDKDSIRSHTISVVKDGYFYLIKKSEYHHYYGSTEILISELDQNTGHFNTRNKVVLDYDSQNSLIKKTYYNYNDKWIESGYYSYNKNTINGIDIHTKDYFDTYGNDTINHHYEIRYNSEGLIVAKITSKSSNNKLFEGYIERFDYHEDGNIKQYSDSVYYNATQQWKPFIKYTNSGLTEDKVEIYCRFEWDSDINDFILNWKFYSYFIEENELEENSKKRFHAYPTPSNDEIWFDCNSHPKDVQIYNLQGLLVMKTQLSDLENRIDLQSLNSGTYIITYKINQETFSQKIIKL